MAAPETFAMALFVSRNLATASDIELRCASEVLWSVRTTEAGDALARVLREVGRRLAANEVTP